MVATGIDSAGVVQKPTPAETRAADITNKLRSEARRATERTRDPVPAVAREQAPAAKIEDAAHAAVAAALLPAAAIEDVAIRPMPAIKPSLFEQPSEAAEQVEAPLPRTFIPPAAERGPLRTPRMPRVDELPVPAQNEIRASRGELADEHPEKRRMSLMQRLASVGLGRRDEPGQVPQPAQHAMPQVKRPVRQRPAEGPGVADYAPRQAPQGLDAHGRAAPVHSPSEEDQLEIPAFLRRQAT